MAYGKKVWSFFDQCKAKSSYVISAILITSIFVIGSIALAGFGPTPIDNDDPKDPPKGGDQPPRYVKLMYASAGNTSGTVTTGTVPGTGMGSLSGVGGNNLPYIIEVVSNISPIGNPVYAVANSGFVFSGWSDGFTGAMRLANLADAGQTIWARFKPVSTVTFLSAGNTSGTVTTGTVPGTGMGGLSGINFNNLGGWSRALPITQTQGNNLSKIVQGLDGGFVPTAVYAVAKSGFVFSGWSDGFTGAMRIATIANAGQTIWARFKPVSTVTFLSAGNTSGTVTTGTVPGTGMGSLSGVNFLNLGGWSRALPITQTQGNNLSKIVQGLDGGFVPTAVYAVAKSGFVFSGWSDGFTGAMRIATIANAGQTIWARFKPVSIVTYMSAGNTTGIVRTGTVPGTGMGGLYGNNFNNLGGWSRGLPITQTSGGPVTKIVQGLNGGYVPSTVYAFGKTGFSFSGWSDGYTGFSRLATIANAGETIWALFKPSVVTYNPCFGTGGSGGFLSGNGYTNLGVIGQNRNVVAGSYLSTLQQWISGPTWIGTPVHAIPNPGLTFAGWSDGVMSNPRIDTMATLGGNNNVTVCAQFN